MDNKAVCGGVASRAARGPRESNFIGVINGPGINGSALVGTLINRHVSVVASGTRAAQRHVVNVIGNSSFRVICSSAPNILGPGCGLRRSVLNFSRSTLASTSILLCMASIISDTRGGTFFLSGIGHVSRMGAVLVIGGVSLVSRGQLRRLISF